MYIEVQLVPHAYSPLKLTPGMIFIEKVDDHLEAFELDENIGDRNAYINKYGHPVELRLYTLNGKEQIATHEEIAWVDEGEDSEDMHTITIDDINIILANRQRCLIRIDDELYGKEKLVVPVYDEEKVIIRLVEEDE